MAGARHDYPFLVFAFQLLESIFTEVTGMGFLAMKHQHGTLKVKPLRLCTYNTLQFKDYSRYEAEFSEEDKRAYREANWDGLCDTAKQIGRKLIENDLM